MGDGPSWPLSEPRWERTLWWQTARKGWAHPGKEVLAFGSRVEKPPTWGHQGLTTNTQEFRRWLQKPMKQRAASKEAAGGLSGDDELKREGQVDRATARAKGKVREAGRKLEEVIDRTKEKASPDDNRPAKDN